MATYKAVMRPTLEYASSIWSPLASSTSINKLEVMQNAALRTATRCIQDTNIQHVHDKTLILPIHEHLQLHASQCKQKTNMRHIHTYIVSGHLATRGNNKILRTPPPHTSSSEERLPRLTRRTLAQLRINHTASSHIYTKSTPNHIHHHYSPSVTLTQTTHDTHHLFNCTYIHTILSPLDLWTDPDGVTVLLARWTEKLPGGPQAKHSPPPNSKGYGSE